MVPILLKAFQFTYLSEPRGLAETGEENELELSIWTSWLLGRVIVVDVEEAKEKQHQSHTGSKGYFKIETVL